MISTPTLDLVMTLKVTTLESTQWVEPNKRGIWMKQGLMIQNYVVPITTFKNVSEKQTAFRSASGKGKQLDLVSLTKEAEDTVPMPRQTT